MHGSHNHKARDRALENENLRTAGLHIRIVRAAAGNMLHPVWPKHGPVALETGDAIVLDGYSLLRQLVPTPAVVNAEAPAAGALSVGAIQLGNQLLCAFEVARHPPIEPTRYGLPTIWRQRRRQPARAPCSRRRRHRRHRRCRQSARQPVLAISIPSPLPPTSTTGWPGSCRQMCRSACGRCRRRPHWMELGSSA